MYISRYLTLHNSGNFNIGCNVNTTIVYQWKAFCDNRLSFYTLSSSSDINLHSSPPYIVDNITCNFAIFSPPYSVHAKKLFHFNP